MEKRPLIRGPHTGIAPKPSPASSIADDVMSTAWRSLSVLIGDAARAFRRLAPMAFAEVSTHALVAHDASDEVTAAVRQAYIHHLPAIRPP